MAIKALPNPETPAVNPLKLILTCSPTLPKSLSCDSPCDKANAPCTFKSAFSTSSDSPPNKAKAPCAAAIPPAAVLAAVVNA